jgi:DHA2 family multidrug resistance protein
LGSLGFSELKSLAVITKNITNQAFMLSTNDIFYLSGWIFISLMVVIWLSKPPFMGTKNVVAGE